MSREFLHTVESMIVSPEVPKTDVPLEETVLRYCVPEMLLKLYGKVAIEAQRQQKWTSITARASLDAPTRLRALNVAMANISGTMQQEGFQTDDARAEIDGAFYHQLTVFWADGKDIYEKQLHRLGTLDTELLQTAASI